MKLGSLFDGLYTISDDGRLYSNRSDKYLKPSTDKYGYLYYVISINSKRFTLKAHRLVATTFIPNTSNKPTVDHINGDRKDNVVSNLRWATYKEQQQNPITKEIAKQIHQATDYRAMGGKRNFGRKRTAVYKAGELIDVCDTLMIAAEKHNVSYPKASECANGKRKTVGGMTFCFV
jgi:hypothetical protein